MIIKNYLFILLLAYIGLLQAQYTAIPDNGFEEILIIQGIDTDGVINGQVLTSNINTITNLDINNVPYLIGVSDLTGIEDFTALENLNCKHQYLTELHIESNIALKVLDCSINVLLTDIDLSQNINLEYIDCSYIGDVWGGINIDFSNNIKLEYLRAMNSSFNSLDLSSNVNLKELRLMNDLYDDFGLESFIATLDLTNNTQLEFLECYNTGLETLSLPNTNTLTYVNLQMQNLSAINVSQNPNLEYLNLLLNNNLSILDITSNPNLIHLDVNKCNLTAIDVSQNLLLERLYIGYEWLNNVLIEPNFYNNIQNIDVTNNSALKSLSVRNINLDVLNLINNPDLTNLNAENNNLSTINLTNNIQLKTLNINENPLQEVDLSNNTALEFLSCEDTTINNLNLKNNNNQILNYVYITNNSDLTCIDVDNQTDANNNIGFYTNWQKDTIAVYSENCAIVSVEDELLENIELYPNPTKDILFIKNTSITSIQFIKVYNMLGQKVLMKKDNLNQINLSELKPALYLVTIKTKNGIINIKILKE